jgi:hypothetical protein
MSQNDFNIANQGFPSFRSDLNSALQALASLSSGDTAPTTTYANQLWYETDTNTLYIRDEANSAWLALMVIDQATGSPSFTAGNVGIGTSSPGAMLDLTGGNAGLGILAATNRLRFTDNDPTLVSGQTTGSVEWYTSDTDSPGVHAYIGTLGANTGAAALTFGTGVGGSAAERMRIDSSGNLVVGKTAIDFTTVGVEFRPDGQMSATRDGQNCINVNRLTNDGGLVNFQQANTTEGSISVSGTTVSYNGGHLSRWAQFPDNSRPELLKGTVMSNLDQMSNWDQEDNEQLNCVQVSAVEGDANVAGVFVAWDSTEDDYNDILLGMTGDMVIRIAGGTTVQRGDLLMSAGDGTAKPQGDDIVRSKTIAKVTSTHVSHTYADGSYAVPCVLMAC